MTTELSASVARGCVIRQTPVAGNRVSPGSTVDLVISLGPPPTSGWSYISSDNVVWGLTVADTLDHGYIIGGGHTGYNMYALKLTAAGGAVWDATYSNKTHDSNQTELWRHYARSVRQTSDLGYIMLGNGHDENDGLPSSSFLLVKTSSTGEVAWSKAYQPINPYDSQNRLCSQTTSDGFDVTRDGGYVAFGSSYVGARDLASILKTDADGEVEFLKVINDNGRAYEQQISGGQQTQDDGYILVGSSSDGPHGYMALLIKLDSDGNWEWSKTYQDVAAGYGCEAYAVTQTEDGGYVLGGLRVNNITKDAKVSTHGGWMAKVDSDGDIVWLRSYDQTPTIHYPNAIKETPQHDLLAVGSSPAGDMELAKFTSNGLLLWNFTDDDLPSTQGNDLTLTDDGGCVVVGSGSSGGATSVVKVNYVYDVE